MVVYTLEQRWEILRYSFENHDNVAECAKIAYGFWEKEKHRPLRMFGGILIDKLKRKNPKTVRTPDNIATVPESVCEAPSTSIQRGSQLLNISDTPLRRILHKDIGMTTYSVQLVQELKPIDHPMRLHFAKCTMHGHI